MVRSLLLVLLSSCVGAACGGPRPPAPTHPRPQAASSPAPAPEPPAAVNEPPLGSMAMALHLYAAPPPASLLSRVGPGPRWPESLRFPSRRHVIGRTFGSGRSRCHLALDIGAHLGEPVSAAEGGVVAYVGPFATGGLVVMLVHAGGFVTVYAHLSASLVQPGDTVARGQRIARAGSSGNSNGPHLHFVLLIDGHPVDPLPMLVPRPSFIGEERHFASPQRAAQAWRGCPPRGRVYAGPED